MIIDCDEDWERLENYLNNPQEIPKPKPEKNMRPGRHKTLKLMCDACGHYSFKVKAQTYCTGDIVLTLKCSKCNEVKIMRFNNPTVNSQ
jgi:ribosomal protein L44E